VRPGRSSRASGPVTPADIAAKMRSIAGDVKETTEESRESIVTVIVVAAVAVLAVAYLFGRRRGRLRSTVVEITRR